MNRTYFASLFGPGCASFSEAQAWSEKVKSGEITDFVPVHGKIAGYHVEKDDNNVPIQGFNPPAKPDTPVKILCLNKCGNISIAIPEGESEPKYFPHINANVEYEAA